MLIFPGLFISILAFRIKEQCNIDIFLGIAAQEGHELCVVALLEHGADPNHSDACGRNALKVAAKSGHRGVVRLLEEYNARSQKMAHTSSSANSITSGKKSIVSFVLLINTG